MDRNTAFEQGMKYINDIMLFLFCSVLRELKPKQKRKYDKFKALPKTLDTEKSRKEF